MTSAGSEIHVFLADDSAAIRQRVAAMLVADGMRVAGEAETPVECIDAILAVLPDVVVLDVQLRGGTGLQVLDAVRAQVPDMVFVVFSNHADPAYRSRYLARGAAAFLDKTTESGRLVPVVRSACRRAQP
ncbi:MAG: response regulator [Ramlibacter sp.]